MDCRSGMTEPLVSIVIPTYNRKKAVLECLQSLTTVEYSNCEVIVVDNGSTDGTPDDIEKLHPKVKLIRSSSNLGVTGGRNLGAKHSCGEHVFFLDHDTVVDKSAICELVEIIQSDSRIGVVGPGIYYYDEPEKIWALGTSIGLLTGKVSFNYVGRINNGQFAGIIDVQVLPTAFLVRRKVLETVDFFDDTYFATYEDTDFCFRVRKAGYRVVCLPKAKVWHKELLSDGRQEMSILKTYYMARNRTIFMKKHATHLNFMLFLIMFMPIYAVYYTFNFLKLSRPDLVLNYWRGVMAGLQSIK